MKVYGKIGLIGRGKRLLRKVFLIRKGFILINCSKRLSKDLNKRGLCG